MTLKKNLPTKAPVSPLPPTMEDYETEQARVYTAQPVTGPTEEEADDLATNPDPS